MTTPAARQARDVARRASRGELCRRALLPIVGSLALLLAICGAAFSLAVASRNQGRAAAHEELIDRAAGDLYAQMLAAETSQRGFLVTERANYLAPFVSAAAAARADLDQLVRLSAGDDAHTAVTQVLGHRLTEKLAEMERTIALVNTGKVEAARTLVNSDLGRGLSEQIKTIVTSLQKSVGDSRRAAALRNSRALSRVMVAIGLAGLGALMMAAFAIRTVLGQWRMLVQRELQLADSVATLDAQVVLRTAALQEVNQRFQVALDFSGVTVFAQDRDLTYSWISKGFRQYKPQQIVGMRDPDILPAQAASDVGLVKRAVLENGAFARAEICVEGPPSTLWFDLSLLPTIDQNGLVTGLIGGAVDISERKNYESHVRLLMRELTHRSMNLLAVVQGLMRQTASRAVSVEDFAQRFGARLEALAGSHNLLLEDDWRGTTLEALVRSQLGHYTDQKVAQITWAGPNVALAPDAAQSIGMALHEMATNATKYGALSRPGGTVRVEWDLTGEKPAAQTCRICWQEAGGPVVTKPTHRGFGQAVIERSVARAVNGQVSLSYNPDGFAWALVFPVGASPEK